MRFWWVNQNRTGEQEISGGYLWAPKTDRRGLEIQSYKNMRLISPGDPILSFRESYLGLVSISTSYAYESLKPKEFGDAGEDWADLGWCVDAAWADTGLRLRPRNYLEEIHDYLPEKHSPLQKEGGGGNQAYLFEISEELYAKLMKLLAQS